MPKRSGGLVSLVLGLALVLVGAGAYADNKEGARAHFEQGNASFALGDYGAAAVEYEKAFALRPDPALLYNAAQAHRLANNKARALLLYKNYLSVYGQKVSNRDEVQRHIATLKQAIEIEQKSQSSPPTGTAPVEATPRGEPTVRPSEPTARPEPQPAEVKPAEVKPAGEHAVSSGPGAGGAGRTKLFAGIGVAAGGLALLVTGGALFGVASAGADEINHPAPGYVFNPDTESAVKTDQAAGIALLAIGGAAVATGVVLAVIGARERKLTRLAWAPLGSRGWR